MAIRQVIYRDNAWTKGFFLATIIHWIIILVLLWAWTTYQESDTIAEARYCLIVDKQPVIHEIQIERQCYKPPPPKRAPPPRREPVKEQQPPPKVVEEPVDDPQVWVNDYLERLRIRVMSNRRYPEFARQSGLEGTPVVQFFIHPDGRLTNVTVAKSSGHTVLDEASVYAVESVSPAEKFPKVIEEALKSKGLDSITVSVGIGYSLSSSE